MKKFVFTLEAVQRFKLTVEKKQKAELARFIALLNSLYAEREGIIRAIDDTAASLARALSEGADIPEEMRRHDLYRQLLQERLEQTLQKIERAEEEKQRAQEQLLTTMKELKSLERLREEQYAAYLEEVRQEDDKLIGDLISYSSATAGENQ